MPTCRSCKKAVIWVVVAKTGRRMPVDATPTPDGPVALDGPQGSARALRPEEEYSGLRYTPHHATCPEGPGWRGQTREQLRLDGLETPAPRPGEGRPAPRRGAAAAAGYSATTTRAWQCPGCHQLRFGRVCKACREARPELAAEQPR